MPEIKVQNQCQLTKNIKIINWPDKHKMHRKIVST